MESYKKAFGGLNDRQRQAVEQIDGPVLVIAGPGTGKTQLIGTRVGYILDKTDAPADSILLLTFTEAGVQAMRERLGRLIGRAAYDVQLNTYHAFGGEIFRRYPDYFEGANLALIEELGADSLLRGIIAKLPYSNPLKFADNYVGELKDFISEAKRALLEPEDIAKVAAVNLEFIEHINDAASDTMQQLMRVSKKAVPAFEDLLEALDKRASKKLPAPIRPLVEYAAVELKEALAFFASSDGKTMALSEWKKHWLAKDEQGRQIFDGQRLNRRLEASAGIYKTYQQSLKAQQLYDYDDMVLRAIDALEGNPELKYSLAERYSYIMLDEFQDTNPAQFRLVQLLTDHPVHEGRPNILAVGDDDQAIYAFQGAEQGNMSVFANHYEQVKIISLEENYRSWPTLLEAGQNIAGQIQNRLHHEFKGVAKNLTASGKDLPGPPAIEFRQFKSDAAQYGWIADEVKQLVDRGTPPAEIAVLAPKHRYLAPLLPYLTDKKLSVRYERRENVLDQPLVYQLERMSQLILALAGGDETLANSLWPEILSYDFWRIPTEKIWRLNWSSRQSHEPWTAALLNDETLSAIASFFLRLAAVIPVTSFEDQLDALIGLPEAKSKLNLPMSSPVYDYYFSKPNQRSAIEFSQLIGELNVLRTRLRDWRRSQDEPISLRTFVEFTQGHRAAKLNLLNTSPYHETDNAVNLLTAYGAKGREFRSVFIVGALDEVWGSASRNQGYRLALPANLSYIRYQGASEDERLRLLFVAATRARSRLYLTSYTQDLAGKRYTDLKYLDIKEDETGRLISATLPEKFQKIKPDSKKGLPKSEAVNYWQDRHLPPLEPKLKQVLAPRLASYQLSATHLNQFTDIVNAGPDYYFMRCLLGFPSAPTPTSAFGTAIHNSLRSAGNILASEGALPTAKRLSDILEAQLGRIELPPDEIDNLFERGRASLSAWLEQKGSQLSPADRYEYDFQGENSTSGAAWLAGKIDRLLIDEKTKKIIVYDYKTGQSFQRWQSGVIKLHKFQQQLMFYKLLVETSARFRGYQVVKGVIEFAEPDETGQLNSLELDYQAEDIQAMSLLVRGVWRHIQNLDFPDTSAYLPSVKGILQFEADLGRPK